MKKPYAAIWIICLFVLPSLAHATEGNNRNKELIVWQPDTEISLSDYQDTISNYTHRVNELYGLNLCANIQLMSKVDIPLKKKDRGIQPELAYFGAVFCKHCSSYLKEDTTQLKHDRIFFDIAELCARKARQELESVCQIIPDYGVKTIFTHTIMAEMNDLLFSIVRGYRKEVLVDKKEGAYEEWMKMIADMLRETRDYATKPEDYTRFISNEPIRKGYTVADTIVGDLRRKKKEPAVEKETSVAVRRAQDYISNLNIPNENLSLTELKNLNIQKTQKTSIGYVIKSEFFQKGAIKNIVNTSFDDVVVILTVKASPVNQCIGLERIVNRTIIKPSGEEIQKYLFYNKDLETGKLKLIKEKNIVHVYYFHR